MARSSDTHGQRTGAIQVRLHADRDHGREIDHAADPLARAIYNLLRDRSLADRRYVLFAVRARFTSYAPDRVTLCLNALNLCLADEDHLSQQIYDRWRRRQADPSEWPSSQFIRTTFDSWAKAMDVAGQEVIGDVLAKRLLSHSRAFSREEVIAAIQLYQRSGGTLTWPAFREWAAAQMQNPDREIDRVIRSLRPIQSLFGTWGQALVAAGYGEQAASRPISRRVRVGSDQRHQRGIVGRRDEYTAKRLKRWLKLAVKDTGLDGTALTVRRYDEWAKARSTRLLKNGKATAIARSQTVMRMFGSWPQALQEAGLIDKHAEAALIVRRGVRRSDDELVGIVAEALRCCGEDLTAKQFDEWRQQVIRQRNLGKDRPPTSEAVRKRLGGWTRARKLARDSIRESSSRRQAKLTEVATSSEG